MAYVRVPMTPVPEGATQEDRERMFREWCALNEMVNGSNRNRFGFFARIFGGRFAGRSGSPPMFPIHLIEKEAKATRTKK